MLILRVPKLLCGTIFFRKLTIFCISRELIFAIVKDCFFFAVFGKSRLIEIKTFSRCVIKLAE